MVEGKEKRGESVKQWFGIKKGGSGSWRNGKLFFSLLFPCFQGREAQEDWNQSNGEAPWTMSSFLRTLGGYNKKNLVEEKRKKKKILFVFFSFFFLSGVFFYFILTSMQRSGIKISHQESTRHPLNLSAVDTSSQDRVITLRVTSGRHTKLQIIY